MANLQIWKFLRRSVDELGDLRFLFSVRMYQGERKFMPYPGRIYMAAKFNILYAGSFSPKDSYCKIHTVNKMPIMD